MKNVIESMIGILVMIVLFFVTVLVGYNGYRAVCCSLNWSSALWDNKLEPQFKVIIIEKCEKCRYTQSEHHNTWIYTPYTSRLKD
jgi:hypothetical protein